MAGTQEGASAIELVPKERGLTFPRENSEGGWVDLESVSGTAWIGYMVWYGECQP
jgi:hypothetical protein